MTRIMKFLALAAVASVAGNALAAGGSVQLAPKGTRVVPKTIAHVLQKYYENGKLKVITTPAVPYTEYQAGIAVGSQFAFDMWEPDPTTYAGGAGSAFPGEDPAYGASCGAQFTAGSRWWFGGTYTSGMNSYNDMTVETGAIGSKANRTAFSWALFYDTAVGAGYDPANMAAIFETCENYDTVTPGDGIFGGPNGRGDLNAGGVLVTFGPAVSGGGYFFTDINLSGGFELNLPTDGSGGYYVSIGDYDTVNNIWTYNIAQNMLWGFKSGNTHGGQTDAQFDDDGPADGNWDPALENYSYLFGVCPDPLGATAMFMYDPPAVLAPTGFTVGLGSVISGNNASLAADDGNPLKLCKAFVPNFASPRMRFDADFLSPYLTASAIQLNLKARMTTGGSFKVRAFIADRVIGGAGTFTYGAANQVVADTTINLTFALYSGNSTNVASNIHTDGTMRSRVEIQQTGFSAVFVPCSEFEFLNITVTP